MTHLTVQAIDPETNRARIEIRYINDIGQVFYSSELDVHLLASDFATEESFKAAVNKALLDERAKRVKAKVWRGLDWSIVVPGIDDKTTDKKEFV